MENISIGLSIVTLIIATFVGGDALAKFGWTVWIFMIIFYVVFIFVSNKIIIRTSSRDSKPSKSDIIVNIIVAITLCFLSGFVVQDFSESIISQKASKEALIEKFEKQPNKPVMDDSLVEFNDVKEKQIAYWEKEYKPLTEKEKKDGTIECRADLQYKWDKTMKKLISDYGEFEIVGAEKVNDTNYIIQVKPEIKDYSSMKKLS